MKLFHGRNNLLIAVIGSAAVFFMLSNVLTSAEEQDDQVKRTVSLSMLEGTISPGFELTLPSGSITERFEHRFNNIHTIFNLNFNFLNKQRKEEGEFKVSLHNEYNYKKSIAHFPRDPMQPIWHWT